MIYSETDGLAAGIQKTVDAAILLATTQAQIAALFLGGTPKVLLAFWEGELNPEQLETFDPLRGDGRLDIVSPGCPGYQLPPTWDDNDANANIRAGVPMWLLKSPDQHQSDPYVLGMGALHPRWSSATLDLYCPATRRKLCRMYFGDPRRDMRHPHEDWPSFSEQKHQIEEAGGTPEPGPILARRHRGFQEN